MTKTLNKVGDIQITHSADKYCHSPEFVALKMQVESSIHANKIREKLKLKESAMKNDIKRKKPIK